MTGGTLIVAETKSAAGGLVDSLVRRHGKSATRVAATATPVPSDTEPPFPPELSHIYVLAGFGAGGSGLSGLAHAEDAGVLALFRLVKSLVAQGASERPLSLRVVTHRAYGVVEGDEVLPLSAGVIGLCRTIAAEYPRWRVSHVDVRLDDVRPAALDRLVDALLAEPPLAPGVAVAIRGGRRHVRTVEPFAGAASGETLLRPGGCYMIVGGAGGIGLELAHWLARDYAARLILVGRRPLDHAIWQHLDALERSGGEVLYARADAGDEAALCRATQLGREHFGQLHGAIHSAVVLSDGLLDRMDESAFRSVLAPKTAGTVALQKALGREPLDFVLLLSSAASIVGNAGQGNYAAASTFQDAYASALAGALACPVRVVNWGYWGTVGVVATEAYRERMAAVGVGSISPAEGIATVQRALARVAPDQIYAVKGDRRFLERAGLCAADRFPERIPSVLDSCLGGEVPE